MRTVVITGAASGIGRALAQGFAADGWRVFGADVDEAGLAALGDGIDTHRVDVCEQPEVEALVEAAVAESGRVDVLFNNAGYGLPHTVEDTPDGAFERLVAVHLFGALHGTRAAIPHMKRQGRGHIVNTLSRGGEFHAPGGSAYAAAKAGMWALTRSTARELRGTGVLVNGMIPGPTNTSIWGKDRPDLQTPESVYPHARFLAELEPDGPTGKVFWDSKEYPFGDPANRLVIRPERR